MVWLIACALLLSACERVFPLDAPEACSGNSPNALLDLCVEAHAAELSLVASIDTGRLGSSPGDCDEVIVQGDVAGTELCVISAGRIEIGNTQVVGQRPLALFSLSGIEVTGVLSAASRRGQPSGAGADFAGCQLGTLDGMGAAGGAAGGGGAGGSFQTTGGTGGKGGVPDARPNAMGGLPALDGRPPGFIHGGCPGGAGGSVTLSAPPEPDLGIGGTGGHSGGALYLVARGAVTITGTIDVSGEGGRGGTAGSGSGGGGGGGGGAGGLIALDAPAITLTADANLIANGGGGGAGGAAAVNDGLDGGSADITTFPFSAPGGGGVGGGDGGVAEDVENGGAENGHDVIMGVGSGAGGGGGGGGGAGFILIFGTLDDQDASSSPNYDNS